MRTFCLSLDTDGFEKYLVADSRGVNAVSWEDMTYHDKTAAILVRYDIPTKSQLPRYGVDHCHVAQPLRSQTISCLWTSSAFREYCEIETLTEKSRVAFRSENTSIENATRRCKVRR